MKNFEDLKNFISKYKGAIIGGLVAILLICTGLFNILLIFSVIVIGIIVGNYVQANKELVKEKLKKFIDKF